MIKALQREVRTLREERHKARGCIATAAFLLAAVLALALLLWVKVTWFVGR